MKKRYLRPSFQVILTVYLIAATCYLVAINDCKMSVFISLFIALAILGKYGRI